MNKFSTISLTAILLPFFIGILYAPGNKAMAAVTADFQSNVNLVATGSSVNFLDLTTGDPVSWNWTFAGGTPSSWSGKVPPSVSYNTAGEYTVILEVEDGEGNISVETKTAYIDVDDYPAGWDVIHTGSSHLISIPLDIQVIGEQFAYGDFIGAFYLDENSQEKCGGYTIWDDESNKVVAAFGDDLTTDPEKEGFVEGENFLWKVYYASVPETKEAIVTYDEALPNNDGTFADNGLSSLSSILTGLLEVSASADPESGCVGEEIQLLANASGGSGSYNYSWSSDPAGFSSSLQNPVVYPSENTTYTVEVDDGISTVSDDVSVTISPAPAADAGLDQSLCMPDVVTLAGTAENYSTIQWTSSGSGTFDDNTSLNTSYNPSQADIDNGSADLTLVAGPIDPCQLSAEDAMTALFEVAPTANAGADMTACQGESVSLSAVADHYCGLLWSGDGDGTFDNPSGLSTTYFPGAGDIALGTVEICLQAIACDPCSVDASDCLTLTIQKSPAVSVGEDVSICEGETISPPGDAANYCNLLWTTNGDGTFNDAGNLTPVYTPGQNDIASGTVELCLEAEACDPCMESASDCLTLTIAKQPIANAGNNQTVCEDELIMLDGTAENYCGLLWTSDGDGTFDNASAQGTQYFPGIADINGGAVELCFTAIACDPCLVNAYDCLDLVIQKKPSADAGADLTVCEGDQVIPASSADGYCDLLWTTSGDGSFDDPSAVVPQYTPGVQDIESGQVDLCIFVTACNPCFTNANDCVTISIQKQVSANAGNDMVLCEGENVVLNATAENYCGLLWTSNGDGTFGDNTGLSTTYYPGANDVNNGELELCFTAAACNPCEVDAVSCLDITIEKSPVAVAGPDATVCQGETYTLSEATAENYSSVQWSSINGTGTFDNELIENPVYTPSASDIQQGCISLQLEAFPNAPCQVSDTDIMELCFQAPPQANAGSDAFICEDDVYSLATASAADYAALQWLSTGDGVFDNTLIENPTYTHGENDLITGLVTLTIVAQAADPCLGSVQDEMVLAIQPKPQANAGDNATISEGESYTNTDASVENHSNFFWETTGDGNFEDNSLLNPTYLHGEDDELNGSVELCLIAEPIAPCLVADEDCLTLVIGLAPNVYAGPDATICEGLDYSLDQATADNYLSILWNTSGDGTFSDASAVQPVYYPGTGDAGSGAVELCITAQPVPPSTVVGSNCMVLTIRKEPAIEIGADQTICQGDNYFFSETVATNYTSLVWETADGAGQFSDAGALMPTYTPAETDYALGCISIQATALPIDPCTTQAVDEMNLCFQMLPSAIAGEDATICEGTAYNLSGQVTEACGKYWETNGDGTFDDDQNLFATYAPGSGDIAAGFVELCLFADPCNPCSIQDTDCLTIFIQPGPVANAGADGEICEDDVYQTAALAENTCGVLWTSTGDGGFDNADELLTAYTPGVNDIATGSVTLCLEGLPCNPCDISVSDCMTLAIVKNPTADAGSDETICEGEVLEINDAVADNYSAIQWFSPDGTGSFSNESIMNPVYTPSAADYQMDCITLGIQAMPENPCVTVAEDFRSLCFRLKPVVDAGLDATICEDDVHELNPTAQNACGLLWESQGDGSFDDPQIAGAVYLPGPDDIQNGVVELCLTLQPCEPCTGTVTACLTLTIQNGPEAFAGDDAAIAEGQSYTLSQATAANYNNLQWATDGDGAFDNSTTLNAVYTPGSNDISNGFVGLCLTATPIDPCQIEAVDCMEIVIGPYPVVSAGNDQVICEGENVTLVEATAKNYQSLLWTTGGDGTFDDVSAENPTYFPGLNDLAAGVVELCITADAIPPATGSVNDCMNLSFQASPVIDAGPDATVCEGDNFTTTGASGSDYAVLQWITTTGTGEFIDPNVLEATYVPTFLDFVSGCVTLQVTVSPIDPCSAGTSDVIELCFQAPPEAFAGQDVEICETDIVTLQGEVNSACGFQWTTSGNGVFSDTEDLNATYTPGTVDLMLGFAELCLQAESCDPCTVPDSDCMTVTILPAPTADAGPNAEVCEDATYQLSGNVENACGLLWESQGDGSFDNASSASAVYTPGFQDIQNGFVELCLSAEPCSPCDIADTDCMLLNINESPTAYAGEDITICEGVNYQLVGVTATNYDGLSWTTSGTGQFDDPQSLSPVYMPSSADADMGCVTLTIQALPMDPCTLMATDNMALCFQLLPEVDAGSDVTICEGDGYTPEILAENACGFSWSTAGDGAFDNSFAQNPTYTPGVGDYTAGSVEICVIAEACDPCTANAEDCLTIFFQPGPIAIAGPDDGVLAGNPFVFEDADAENFASLLWITNGDGTFEDPTILNPTYNHGPLDEADYGVELCLTAQPVDPCQLAVQDCMLLQIGSMPVITAGPDITLCEDNEYLILDATAENYSSILWNTSGDGTFDDISAENPVYTMGPDDLASGNVELCLLAEPVPPATISASDCMMLSVVFEPEASAGNDVTLCGNNPYTLSGSAENYCDIVWTTSGDGTFDDDGLLQPQYIPGDQDMASGSAEICIQAFACNPCLINASDCMTMVLLEAPEADAGDDFTICENKTAPLSGTVANNCDFYWETTGDGEFDDITSITPTYTPGVLDVQAGFVEICLVALPCEPCTSATTDCMNLFFQLLPQPDPGPDASVCSGDTYDLNATLENGCGFFWQTTGSGSFSNPGSLETSYVPSAADYSNGSVDISLFAFPCNPCTNFQTETMTLSFVSDPTVDAGEDVTICSTEALQLDPSVQDACAFLWETAGDGTFDNASIPNALYFPGPGDAIAGTVELCITALPCGSCETPAYDCLTVTVIPGPTVDAGDDATVCENQGYELLGTSENNCGIQWSTAGDGTFDNPVALNAYYTPGTQDIENGLALLTLSADACAPCTSVVSDNITLSFVLLPTVVAGEDASILAGENYQVIDASVENAASYSWSSNGDGVFDDPVDIAPVYTPGDNDVSTGLVTLCLTAQPNDPCTTATSDCLSLSISSPVVVDAGPDATICEGNSYYLELATAENYSAISWNTSGDGTFNDDGALNPVYFPGSLDIANGTAVLCLEAQPVAPSVLADQDCMTLHFQLAPVANAGADFSICADENVQLSGMVENACGSLWYTNGTGTFDNPGLLDATYIPGTSDVANGSVTLCLIAESCNPCDIQDEDCLTVFVEPAPFVDAGDDAEICEGDSYVLNGSAEHACGVLWSTSGTGNFSDPGALGATYFPSMQDLANGSVELCLTAEACEPCTENDEDCMTLTFVSPPLAFAGDDITICEDETLQLDGFIANACDVTWSTNGFGSFDDIHALAPVYTPGGFDVGLGTIEICVTAEPCDPCTAAVVDCLNLSFVEQASVDAGENDAVCQNAPYQLNGDAEHVSSILWSTSGDGVFDDAEVLDAVYTPGMNDVSNGVVDLTLTGYAIDPCTVVATDAIALTLHSCQVTVIPAGWSGISTWVDPLDTELEELFAPVLEELIILQTMEESWWPAENYNTIGTWDYLQGYKIKVTEEVTINVPGNPLAGTSLNLDAGWNLIPVLSSCEVDVAQLFDGTSVVMVKEVAGWKLYWPQYEINTLELMMSGSAYFVYMETAGSITFPACDSQKTGYQPSYSERVSPACWMDVIPSAATHVIGIPAGVVEGVEEGDYIGVVDHNGDCFGFTAWTGKNLSIAAFGDDPTTEVKDGFEEGESMRFVLLDNDNMDMTELAVVYDKQYLADGLFTENGISLLKAAGSAGISDPASMLNFKIYPNPVKHNLTLELGQDADFDLEILNIQGQLIWTGVISGPVAEVDFSNYNKGVYLVRISGNGESFVERVTKQ